MAVPGMYRRHAALLGLLLLASFSVSSVTSDSVGVSVSPKVLVDESELVVVRATQTGPFEEIKKAFLKAGVGGLLFFLAFPVLWANERREAKMWSLFSRAKDIVKKDVSVDKVDPEKEACLVHMQGMLSTSEQLRDALCNVSVSNCAKLSRKVEMYQWQESEETTERDTMTGGKEKVTTYSYNTDWSSSPVDSSSFQEMGYSNPAMPFQGDQQQAKEVNLGVFKLTERLISKLCRFTSLTPAELPPVLACAGRNFALQGEVYATQVQGAPQVGDIRLSFTKVPCSDASLVAVQHNNTFAPLTFKMKVSSEGRVVRGEGPAGGREPLLDAADDDLESSGTPGCCGLCSLVASTVESGEEIYELAEERTSALGMFAKAQKKQQLIHTLLQIGGFLLLFVGLDCMLSFVPALFRIIPLIGTWIQMFGHWLATFASFLLAGFFWCITVALAWLSMRPVKAAILLAAAALLVMAPTYLAAMQPATHY
ncbi:unnamed protein product [Polarella glacialis]|uniref:Transmembrane protein n=1 Tax=Polarella glacialis TaxID=89957 RepID=A0A813ELR4_POLGL|nr:unnamed protein product [Polarella glacialis]CAE8692723.1 unnamed protein product [Polarella glacialis]